MQSIIEFLRGITGDLSSKRLAFLSSLPFVYFGTLYFTNKLINLKKYDEAVNLWTWFFILVAVFGGFVSAELFKKLPVSRIIKNSKK
jgi:hypothetical protein